MHYLRLLGAHLLLSALAFALNSCSKTDSLEVRLTEVKKRRAADLKDALKARNIHSPFQAYLRVFKESLELEVWLQSSDQKAFSLWKTYPILGMSGSLGPKQQEGDRQAPEGFYSTRLDALNPKSKYHLSFNIGYPNAYDLSQGRTGDLIMVHGSDASEGCFAMGDPAIEEIYLLVEQALLEGQKEIPIHTYPFRMENTSFQKYSDSIWLPFWKELRPSYEHFEKRKTIPQAPASLSP